MFFADFPWMLKSASNAHDVWVKFKVWLTYKLGAVGNQYKVKGHELYPVANSITFSSDAIQCSCCSRAHAKGLVCIIVRYCWACRGVTCVTDPRTRPMKPLEQPRMLLGPGMSHPNVFVCVRWQG
eukprot:jgi/Botrbrau1/12776/Bobra.0238s0014.1